MTEVRTIRDCAGREFTLLDVGDCRVTINGPGSEALAERILAMERTVTPSTTNENLWLDE